MKTPVSLATCLVVSAAAAVLLLNPAPLLAQQATPPWTGVAMNEAHTDSGPTGAGGSGFTHPHALSGDGRFVVFTSYNVLVANDTNGVSDVYVRDRTNGALNRVSVATGGAEGNSHSLYPAISRDGRHVVFYSCATNLVPGDTNGVCDVFAHDRQTGATTRVNIGPNGQQGAGNYYIYDTPIGISADGRFVVFKEAFTISLDGIYLRDRDPDVNGVYDEAGLATTVKISVNEVDGESIGGEDDPAINADGSMIAYTSGTVDQYSQYIGQRLFLFDRINGTTTRVDRMLPSPTHGEAYAYSQDPGFSDNGLVVFASDAPELVAGDTDALQDVFVYDIATTARTRLALTHPNAPALTYLFGPSISADGRYVAFTGQSGEPGFEAFNVYAVDRQTSESYDISVRWDGSRDNEAWYAAISADGSAIAFNGSYYFLANPDGNGVYVTSAVSMSPAEVVQEVPEGNGVPIDVNVPPGIRWFGRLIQFDPDQNSMILSNTFEGIGPTTVDVEVPWPYGSGDQEWVFAVGTETTLVHVRVAPRIQNFDPFLVSPAGGTSFTINGTGFAQGATVLVGGVAATDVVVDEFNQWITATAPPGEVTGDFVPVTVTNPNGLTATEDYGLYYWQTDDTPPAIESNVSGTLGQNGWYRGDVAVSWTVTDPESGVFDVSCASLDITADTASTIATCTASSDGGTSSMQIEIKRDATPPAITIVSPDVTAYLVGQQVALDFSCTDATAGVSSCTSNQSGNMLDTTTPGAFEFRVTAYDNAGNSSEELVQYQVRTPSSITMAPSSAVYGDSTFSMSATLLAGTNPAAGREVRFMIQNLVYTATTGANGVATVTTALAGRNAGGYPTAAWFVGDATTAGSPIADAALTVTPAALSIRADNAAKVYGQALPAFTVSGSGFVNGDSVASLSGTASFSTSATATSAPGSYAVTPGGLVSTNYTIAFAAGTLTINKASTSVALSSSPNPSSVNHNVVITAVVSAVAPGAGAATGTVEFRDNGVVLGTATIVNGTATFTRKFKKGTHPLTAVYAGDANFNGSAGALSHVVP